MIAGPGGGGMGPRAPNHMRRSRSLGAYGRRRIVHALAADGWTRRALHRLACSKLARVVGAQLPPGHRPGRASTTGTKAPGHLSSHPTPSDPIRSEAAAANQ